MNKYLVIGSNNFWYGVCSNKQRAINLAKDLVKDKVNIVFGDPESGFIPEKPYSVYVYKVEKLVAEIE